MLFSSLESMGFRCVKPNGAYYIWCDFSEINPYSSDLEFASNLVKNVGVAGVPGSSFFFNSDLGKKKIRFTFSKKTETIKSACERLESLKK